MSPQEIDVYLRKLIVQLVTEKQGCKDTELIFDVAEHLAFFEEELTLSHSLFKIIEDLIKSGDIIEVQYELPDTEHYLHKSFLLPKNTLITS